MKTVGVRALRENPGILNQCADMGEFVLLTNRNQPMSLSIPFDQRLLENGVHVSLAIMLFEQGAVTLVKAAKIADMSTEAFLAHLKTAGVIVLDQTAQELADDLKTLGI